MSKRWRQIGATVSLLAAMGQDMSRRAWWRMRGSGTAPDWLRTAVIAERPAQQPGLSFVTADWRPAVDAAHAVLAATVYPLDNGMQLPVIWIAGADDPAITDLPRVLAGSDPSLVGTQWLADFGQHALILIATYVEPVQHTIAIRFDLRRWYAIVDAVASAAQLYIALEPVSDLMDAGVSLPHGLWIPCDHPLRLRALLAAWSVNAPDPSTFSR